MPPVSRKTSGSTRLTTIGTQRHLELAQLGAEELGLAERPLLESRDDDESRLRAPQQPVDRSRPSLDPVVQGLQLLHEVRDLGEDLGAEQPVGEAKKRRRRVVHRAKAETGRPSGQQREQPRSHVVGQAARSLEEVERVARRWGVDDDAVVLPRIVQLVERLDRRVLV